MGPLPPPRCTGGVADRGGCERLSGFPAAQLPSTTKDDAFAGSDGPWFTSAPELRAWPSGWMECRDGPTGTGAGVPGSSMRCRQAHCWVRVDALRHSRCPRSAADDSRRLHPWSSSAASRGGRSALPTATPKLRLTTPAKFGRSGSRGREGQQYTDRHSASVLLTLRKAAAGRRRRGKGRKWGRRHESEETLHFRYGTQWST